jgi:hypothetical protein
MKSNPSLIIIVSLVLLAAEATWIYFSWQQNKVPPAPSQVTNQSERNRPTEHRSSSNLETALIVTSNPVKFMDASGYFDLNGLTVGQYVKKYRATADRGDETAAFNIYRAETICAGIPELQQSLNSMSVNSPDTTEKKNAMQLSLKEAQSVCADFKINPKERRDYLLIAAKGGVPAAQVAYLNNPPEGINLANQADPRVIQWQKGAVGFLTQAADQGDLIALSTLADIYESGKMAPQNRQLALTYQIAFNQLSNSRFDSTAITRLSAQLTPAQANAAYDAATDLVSSCCNKN